jgi:GT2 family glycosyltransferase
VAKSSAVVFTLSRFDAGEAAALRSIVAATKSSGSPVVAVTFAAADPATVHAFCEEIGVAVVDAGSHATFGAAANAGAREVTAERLVFVNGAELTTLSSIDVLLNVLDETGAGVVGPRIRAEGGAKEICGLIVGALPDAPRGFDFQVVSGAQARLECDAVPNDCLVTTRQTFDELGGFAETFGSEFEAFDFCLRARESGRRVFFEPGACVTRLAETSDPDEGRAERERAFDARWKERVEYHENLWPELTGVIIRRFFLLDGVVLEPIPVPKVAILVHGEAPSPAFVASLSGSRMKPASAAYAAANDVVRAARTMTELRGPDYVVFVRSDTVLTGDWLNELVNAIEGGPDRAAATLADSPDGRCLLVAPHRIPQHLRIEPNVSFDASVAAWMREVIDAGRSVMHVEKTWSRIAIGTGLGASLPVSVKVQSDPFVSIVMLSWNAPEYTEIAIASIREHTPLPHEIIIIDNGSGVETTSRLEQIPGIRVIYNAVNTGFAFGCNQGLAAARGTHVVLLNNDVVLTAGWLEPMIEVQRRHPTVGCSAPRTNECAGFQKLDVPYASLDDMPAFAAERAIEQRGRWSYQSRVIGFCMCLDRRVVEEIGGLDPAYGTGNCEDDDYCMRIRAAGYEIALCEDSFIHHFGSVTFRTNKVDYWGAMTTNLAQFVKHWDVTLLGGGLYDARTPPRRGFQRERDFVPLPEPVGVGPAWVTPAAR